MKVSEVYDKLGTLLMIIGFISLFGLGWSWYVYSTYSDRKEYDDEMIKEKEKQNNEKDKAKTAMIICGVVVLLSWILSFILLSLVDRRKCSENMITLEEPTQANFDYLKNMNCNEFLELDCKQHAHPDMIPKLTEKKAQCGAELTKFINKMNPLQSVQLRTMKS